MENRGQGRLFATKVAGATIPPSACLRGRGTCPIAIALHYDSRSFVRQIRASTNVKRLAA